MEQFVKFAGITLLVFIGFNANATNYVFVENKGQWESQVEYKARMNYGNLYFEKNRWMIDMKVYDEELDCSTEMVCAHGEKKLNNHAFAINFLDANPESSIKPTNADSYYTNYIIGKDESKWASHVKHYNYITYKNIFECTDLKVEHDAENIKYQFDLKAGIDPSQIKMEFEGVDFLRLNQKNLEIGLSFGSVLDLAPIAWQIIGGNQQFVKVEYLINGNVVSFKFPEGYDNSKALTIDPTLIFASYSGSNGSNYGYSATYDLDENSYAGSWALASGYPVTTGAYDQSYNSGNDAAITKFSADGTQNLYSTYLGGSNEDNPVSLMINSNNELVILNVTNSSNFPTTSGSYDTSSNGNYDFAISILSEDGGTLIASTMYGGNGVDGYNNVGVFTPNYGMQRRGEVFVSRNDTIFITSITESNNIATAGAYDTSKGGTRDGILAKFSPNLDNLLWATYFGGSSDDSGSGVKVSKDYEVYLVGGTRSNNLPTTPGAIMPSFQGGTADGYIAKFSSDGSQLLACTYQGTNNYDQTFFVDVDKDGDVYTFGNALGSYNHPPNYGGNVDYTMNFIHKVDSSLTNTIYTHNFGTSVVQDNNLVPTALSVDLCNRAYISGVTVGSYGCNFPTTSDAIFDQGLGQPNCQDFFVMVLDPAGQNLEYGTFFGSSGWDHVDAGTSRFSPFGFIHQAMCTNGGIPFTAGSYGSSIGSGGWNVAVFKIDMEPQFIVTDAATLPNPAEGCAPFTVTFNNPLNTNGDYFWDFGDGNTDTLQTPTNTFTDIGTFQVSLIVTDSSTCNIRDTSYVEVIVYDSLEAITPAFSSSLLGNCGSTTLQFNNLTALEDPANEYIFTWDFDGLGSTNDISPSFTFPSDGVYNVTLSVVGTNPNGYPVDCKFSLPAIVPVQVPVAYDVDIDISNTAISTCALDPVVFAAIVNTGTVSQYTWDMGDGNPIISDSSFSYQFTDEGVYNVQLTVEDLLSCNQQDVSDVTITVNSAVEAIQPLFTNDLPTNCQDLTVNFSNATTLIEDLAEYNLSWDFGDGGTSTDFSPSHVYTTQGTYNVTLNITGDPDCKVPGSLTIPLTIDIDNTVVADFEMEDLVCTPYSRTLNATQNADSMAWIVDGVVMATNVSSYDFNESAVGTYTVELYVYDATSCNLSDNHIETIEIRNNPSAAFSFSPERIFIGDEVNFSVNSVLDEVDYVWSFGDGTSDSGTALTHNYSQVGIFQVCLRATDQVLADCFDESCKTLETLVDYYIIMPNAFSPNNDGFNDFFNPLVYNVDDYSYHIYNRWGHKVFTGNENNQGWDGKYNGEIQEIGVYMYYFEATLKTGQPYSEKGNITLIR